MEYLVQYQRSVIVSKATADTYRRCNLVARSEIVLLRAVHSEAAMSIMLRKIAISSKKRDKLFMIIYNINREFYFVPSMRQPVDPCAIFVLNIINNYILYIIINNYKYITHNYK